MRLSPLFHLLLNQGRGFTVTGSDPELTSSCVAKETEELRKREEAQAQGVEQESSLSFYIYNSLCLRASRWCSLSSRHISHTHTHTVLLSAHERQPEAIIHRV